MNDPKLEALARWLGSPLGAIGGVDISDASQPSGNGYSAETIMFDAHFDDERGRQVRRLVLRAETPERPVYPSQVPGLDVEIEIQRRLMEAVRAAGGSSVPLADVIGFETTADAIGTPFFVMDFVAGDVPSVDPPYPAGGFFAEAAPEARRSMVEHGVEVLAAIHAVDWRAPVERGGVGWLVPDGIEPTARRQLELWAHLARTELGARHHPGIARGLEILEADLPTGSDPVLCWGDPRLGNMIFRDGRCVCVTDWEAACIAPPEFDVGWWLMFDHACHEAAGIERPPGEPTRAEQQARYEEVSGRSLGDLAIWELFAAVRYAAIAVRVLNRLVDRGLMPEDHPFWLENPASACLALQLER